MRARLQGRHSSLILATTPAYNMAIILTSGHNKRTTPPGAIGYQAPPGDVLFKN